MRILSVVLLSLLAAGIVRAADGVPEGLKGFSGQVQGVVVTKGEGGITFKAGKVVQTWKNNKASNPESLAGQTVQVIPGGGKEGNKFHAAFLRTLQPGQDVTLELRNDGDIFVILELTKEQREAAGVPQGEKGEKREKKKTVGGDRK